MKLPQKPKVLVYDIETSLLKVYSFGIRQRYLQHDDILEDWKILCAAYTWEGEPGTVKAISGSEKTILKKLSKLILEADIIVHHYGSGFDYKRLQTKLLHHRLPPLPPLTTGNHVDTFKAAASIFDFTSNKLDYLAQFLGVGKKHKVDKELWRRVDRGDPKALKEMEEYNKQDVSLLEAVYQKLKPFLHNHPSMAVISGENTLCCPRCLSTKLQARGYRVNLSRRYRRYQCQDCGAWSAAKHAELP